MFRTAVAASLVFVCVAGLQSHSQAEEDEPVQHFSGPQKGEAIAGFTSKLVLGGNEGSEFDPVTAADGKPLVLLFVNEVTRPSVGLTRAVATYAARQRKSGLHAAVVLLSADASQSEQWVHKAQHALPSDTPIAVYTESAEGPGAYGLSRKVAMTVLVARDNKVVANFALVQPSLATDGVAVCQAIAELTGTQPPTATELEQYSTPGRSTQRQRK